MYSAYEAAPDKKKDLEDFLVHHNIPLVPSPTPKDTDKKPPIPLLSTASTTPPGTGTSPQGQNRIQNGPPGAGDVHERVLESVLESEKGSSMEGTPAQFLVPKPEETPLEHWMKTEQGAKPRECDVVCLLLQQHSAGRRHRYS